MVSGEHTRRVVKLTGEGAVKFTAKSPLCQRSRRVSSVVVWGMVLSAVLTVEAEAQPVDRSRDTYVLPPESVQQLFDRDKNLARLDRMSPDGSHFVIPLSNELSSLESMAQRTLRLGMLELVPHVNREWRLATYGVYGLDIYSLNERRRLSIDLPDDIFVSDVIWSPDGAQIAFLAHLAERTQVWTADVSTGDARPLGEAAVMATLAARRQFGASAPSQLLQWRPDGSVLALLVPFNRGPEPQAATIPTGPVVRRTREKPTPTRTLPFLLRTPHDEALFRYYTTAQLAILVPGGPARPIGEPAMYVSIALSPDGDYVLRERLVEPFSYIVGYTSFGRDLDVLDLDGNVVSTIRQMPLHEPAGRENRPDADLPRAVAWRPDGSGVSFLWREPKPDAESDDDDNGERGDRLMLLEPPFDMAQVRTVVSADADMSDVSYTEDGSYVFLTREGADGGGESIVAYDLSADPPAEHVLVSDIDPDEVIDRAGAIMTRQDGNGITSSIRSSDGTSVYLQGDGYSERFMPQPFVDRIAIGTGSSDRVFEGSSEAFDQPLVMVDDDANQLVVSRESKTRGAG